MPTVTGKLVYLEKRSTKKGGPYFRIGVKPDTGDVVFTNIYGSCSWTKGDYVTLEVKDEDAPKVEKGPSIQRDTSRDMSIAKSVALKAAAELAAALKPADEAACVQSTIGIAEELLAWLIKE